MTKPVEAEWISYRKNVVPADAGPVQVVECRRAFYAGAVSMMRVLALAMDPDAEPTEKDMRTMAEIMQELDGYLKEFE